MTTINHGSNTHKALRHLRAASGRWMTAGEVATVSGLSAHQAATALYRLAAGSLVEAKRAQVGGTANVYRVAA